MNLEKPIVIAKNREAKMRIVQNEFERPAGILASYLNKITDGIFQIDKTPSVLAAFVFKTNCDIKTDGFNYYIFDKDIVIEAPSEQAFVYAVYDFLERIAGCRYFTTHDEYIPYDANLTVCFSKYEAEPIMQFRENYYEEYGNPDFSEKHKMHPAEKHEGWGFWCHSFETLVSPAEYFDKHPEYFSLYKGIRVGEKAQLCLSNPKVFDILVKNLKKHMDEKPDAKYWSVSQNDNNAYCECEECRKLDEHDGTPMGSVLNFVNRVAEQFPDKIISTLAYWYTRKPPQHTRPAPNVHIMLCNIEANRGLPIETDERSKESKEELIAWKEICENVFLWDYCIQFRNLVSPFPNLHVLAPNIRFFVENNVRSLFSQSNRDRGGEFCELRGYMLAKLIWEPYRDSTEIMREFLYGYYKQAGAFIETYINKMHDASETAGGELNIFGGPLDYDKTFLSPELYDEYESLFDRAEEAVACDQATLFKVRTARMPLYYAGIVLKYGSREKQMDMIAKFASQAQKTGLEKVEEWTITVDKFVTDSIAALSV